jgi:hypothetical protein
VQPLGFDTGYSGSGHPILSALVKCRPVKDFERAKDRRSVGAQADHLRSEKKQRSRLTGLIVVNIVYPLETTGTHHQLSAL